MLKHFVYLDCMTLASIYFQVDSTLQCMMNESSIDYVRKFADLAEQIAQGDGVPVHNRADILNNHTVKELT